MARAAYMVGFVVAGGIATLLACSPFGGASAFTCTSDEQCSGGTCEADGFCSFASAECPSGRAYGPNSGDKSGQCIGSPPQPDAMPDMAPPTTCTAGVQECFEHRLETCRSDGMGFDPALRVVCPLTCLANACVAASNLAATDQAMCGDSIPAVALEPPAGATVTFDDGQITCDPDCGGSTTIARQGTTPNDWYCLSTINLPAGVTVVRGTQVGALTLFSTGAVTIDASIDVSGGNAAGDLGPGADTPGLGGPGGFAGGALSPNNGDGVAGLGACGGGGGGQEGANQTSIGAGGGGGGYVALGGDGGVGRRGATVATGGTGGVITCDNAEARPLVGGSGGGGGGDGSCGPNIACGWPGGGGGGALHVVSRMSIGGAGSFVANGGNGFGETTQVGGGGGGGAGGTLLLEAPMLAVTGQLAVNGGTGGTASAGTGGAGGSGATAAGAPGTSAMAGNTDGGAGGGGAGGRIRVNASTGASCATASPTASCSTGTLRTDP